MPLDFRDQYFGCEIEMTGLSRQKAAQVLAEHFHTSYNHYGGYDAYHGIDGDGKEWKIVRDGSILLETRNHRHLSASEASAYRVELNSPKLEYSEMGKLQEVVRVLRHAGGMVNSSCGIHHVKMTVLLS